MQKSIFVIIVTVVVAGISTLFGQRLLLSKITNANASNLTGIENDSSSASVTARLNITAQNNSDRNDNQQKLIRA